MGHVRLCCLSFLAAAAVTAGDFKVLTEIRKNTPWSQSLRTGTDALAHARYEQAAQAFEGALRDIPDASAQDRQERAIAANGLGAAYDGLGRYRDAERPYLEALRLWRGMFGTESVVVAIAMNNLGSLYVSEGRYEDGRRYHSKALKIDETLLGENSPIVANDLNNLAVVYQEERRYDKAEPLLRRAIDIGSSNNPRHPRLSEYLKNLAALLARRSRFDEAEALQRRALDMQIAERGPAHPSVGLTLNHLADCEMRQKRHEAAVIDAGRSVAILEAAYGANHPKTVSAYYTLALGYMALKQNDKAEPLLLHILDADQTSIVPPLVRAVHLHRYAILLRARGDKKEAKRYDDMAASFTDLDHRERKAALQVVDVNEFTSGK